MSLSTSLVLLSTSFFASSICLLSGAVPPVFPVPAWPAAAVVSPVSGAGLLAPPPAELPVEEPVPPLLPVVVVLPGVLLFEVVVLPGVLLFEVVVLPDVLELLPDEPVVVLPGVLVVVEVPPLFPELEEEFEDPDELVVVLPLFPEEPLLEVVVVVPAPLPEDVVVPPDPELLLVVVLPADDELLDEELLDEELLDDELLDEELLDEELLLPLGIS